MRFLGDTTPSRRVKLRVSLPGPVPILAQTILGERIVLNAAPEGCKKFGGLVPQARVKDCFGQRGVVIGVGPAGSLRPHATVLWVALDRDQPRARSGMPIVVYYEKVGPYDLALE